MTETRFQEIDIFEVECEYANEAAYAYLFNSLHEIEEMEELQSPIPQTDNSNIGTSSSKTGIAEQPSEDAHELVRRRMGDLACNKAGMQGLDTEKINRIIYEATKGTPFFENEARKDTAVSVRIEKLKERYETLKKRDIFTFAFTVDKIIQKYERERDLSRTIVHIDMDAFYASVEERDYPHLKNVPIAVGDNMMLSTSSYEARKYGVRSAMPGFIAMKLCPQLVIIPCHFDKYTAVSNKIREIFARYDPNFSPVSLDEAYLDITNYLQITNKSPEEISQQIRNEIFEETKLTASAGIGANMLLAKIGSNINKPNGQHFLQKNYECIMEFMRNLPIRKVPARLSAEKSNPASIGKVTERILGALDIKTCADIIDKRLYLYRLFSEHSFNFFMRAALGIGSSITPIEIERKSVGVSRTFSSPIRPKDRLSKLRQLCELLATELDKENVSGKTLSVVFKEVSFRTFTRARTINKYIHSADNLFHYSRQIVEAEMPTDLRLMGIRLTKLRPRDTEIKSGVKRYFPVIGSGSCKKICSGSSNGKKSVESVKTSKPTTSATNSRSKWHEVPAIAQFFKCPRCERQYINEKIAHINEHLDQCMINNAHPNDNSNELIMKTNSDPTIGGSGITLDTLENVACGRTNEVICHQDSRTLIEILDEKDQQQHDGETVELLSTNVALKNVKKTRSLENSSDTENILNVQQIITWECPKCQKNFNRPTLMRINTHLDVCLRKKVTLRSRR
ncbi:7734_t:CDS:10 [Acaulospora morrowiae]|uniref:DNA polymerase kappa n=1 Tax=Acaulospora morrowiae TaxID=94023 RepID=A0A9N8Z4D9_9GLOM|nr:7734_t:CDS:10 [Acaulospora morrowiae]